jgi:N-acyl-D-aspartate/D-glutamate deacylase
LLSTSALAQQFDTVIANGRVIDPESGLTDIRNIGILDGEIATVTTASLTGEQVIDASGLIVAPGFIDLHAHGQDDENYRLKALDGVTTALVSYLFPGQAARAPVRQTR